MDKGTMNPFFTDGKIPDSLTKENFWNKLYEDYPEEMKKFCDWIDEYKKRVNWNFLFQDIEIREDHTWKLVHSQKRKFHDLPIAMQTGIFYQYLCDLGLVTMRTPVDAIFDVISGNIKSHHRHEV